MSQTSFDWDVQEQEEDDSGTGIIKGPVKIIVNNNISGGGCGGTGTGGGTAAIPEPAADGKLYGRVRQEGETDGAWGAIPDPVSIEHSGSLPSTDDLPPDGAGKAWIINKRLWVWNPVLEEWEDQGPFRGADGVDGTDGATPVLAGEVDDVGLLPPAGAAGEYWSVNGDLYGWDAEVEAWTYRARFQGPKGDPGGGEGGSSVPLTDDYTTITDGAALSSAGANALYQEVESVRRAADEALDGLEALADTAVSAFSARELYFGNLY